MKKAGTSVTNRADEILSLSALRWPTHTAVIDQHGSFSYRQLEKASELVAQMLLEVGVVRGSVIGIALVDAKDFLAALFGVLKVGCVVIPVAPNLSQSEQQRVISETHVSWLVSTPRDTERHYPTSVMLYERTTIAVSATGSASPNSILETFPDAAVIRHTSGTTAKSKGVVLSHSAVCQRTQASQALIGVTHNDTVLLPLQLSYHFIASALSCLEAGATIVDCAQLVAPEIIECGVRHRATVIYASPMQYDLISRCASGSFTDLRRAISTSALLPKRTADAFFSRFSCRLTQVYGIIEVGLPLWNELESIDPTALGICKPPYEAIVVGDDGLPVPTGNIGELAIRGPGLFSGYLLGYDTGTPRAASRCLLAGEWFLTGDLVMQDELGVVLYRGRKKSVINCGGNKVFPEEIEEVLQQSPDIHAVRVVSEPHALLGNTLIAEIVVDPQISLLPQQGPNQIVERWRALCFSELSEYKVPQEFRIVDSLPVTGSGKIIRH
ncbi:MAG: class I adenylate-forming enzyme family protein [Pseudomonadota bacterium]|jgi:long-chain acyl-CoA synthetase